jgi:CRISPR-associated protein Csm3
MTQSIKIQLESIRTITAKLTVKTGLHIGAGSSIKAIGGVDSPVIKNPLTQQPYIPASSFKGKIRCLLERLAGCSSEKVLSQADITNQQIHHLNLGNDILKLFGSSADAKDTQNIQTARVTFRDAFFNEEWYQNNIDKRNLLDTEVKSENTINRISGTADNPRFKERVLAGSEFDIVLQLKTFNKDGKTDDADRLMNTLLRGFALLELDALGNSGSRGYGQIEFSNIKCVTQSSMNSSNVDVHNEQILDERFTIMKKNVWNNLS